MTLKNRIGKLEKAPKGRRRVFDDKPDVYIVHDDSAQLNGVEMTPAEYAEYCKAHPGPVITIFERGNDDDKKPNPTT